MGETFFKILTLDEYKQLHEHVPQQALQRSTPHPILMQLSLTHPATKSTTDHVYAGNPLDHRDGFIHLSTAPQSLQVAKRFFNHVDVLVVMELDGQKAPLSDGFIRWEGRASPDQLMRDKKLESESILNQSQLIGRRYGFPHIYGGGMRMSSVVRVFVAVKHSKWSTKDDPWTVGWPIAWHCSTEIDNQHYAYRFDTLDGIAKTISYSMNNNDAHNESVSVAVNLFLDHCANSFVGVPRQLFADHWHHDTLRDPQTVFVVMDESGIETSTDLPRIVASVRVYHRTMSMGLYYKPLRVAAVGDVGTDPDHRRRGLATHLLNLTHMHVMSHVTNIDAMTDPVGVMKHESFDMMLLHTTYQGDAYRSYNRCGWVSWGIPYTTYTGSPITTHVPMNDCIKIHQIRDNELHEWIPDMVDLHHALVMSHVGPVYRNRNTETWIKLLVGQSDPRSKNIVRVASVKLRDSDVKCIGYVVMQVPVKSSHDDASNIGTVHVCECDVMDTNLLREVGLDLTDRDVMCIMHRLITESLETVANMYPQTEIKMVMPTGLFRNDDDKNMFFGLFGADVCHETSLDLGWMIKLGHGPLVIQSKSVDSTHRDVVVENESDWNQKMNKIMDGLKCNVPVFLRTDKF